MVDRSRCHAARPSMPRVPDGSTAESRGACAQGRADVSRPQSPESFSLTAAGQKSP
jgi:hypothetical protein